MFVNMLARIMAILTMLAASVMTPAFAWGSALTIENPTKLATSKAIAVAVSELIRSQYLGATLPPSEAE